MAVDAKATMRLEADPSGFKAAMLDAQKSLKSLDAAAEKTAKATETIGKVNVAAAWAGGIVVAHQAVGFLVDKAKEFYRGGVEIKQVWDDLGNSLKAQGVALDPLRAGIADMAEKLGMAAGIDDEKIVALLGSLTNAGYNVTDAFKQIPLALDVAARFKMSEAEAAALIGNIYQGRLKGLKALQVDYKKTGDVAKDARNAMDALDKASAGAREAALARDPMLALEAAWGNLKDPKALGFLNGATKSIKYLTDLLNGLDPTSAEIWADRVGLAFKTTGDWALWMGKNVATTAKAFDSVRLAAVAAGLQLSAESKREMASTEAKRAIDLEAKAKVAEAAAKAKGVAAEAARSNPASVMSPGDFMAEGTAKAGANYAAFEEKAALSRGDLGAADRWSKERKAGEATIARIREAATRSALVESRDAKMEAARLAKLAVGVGKNALSLKAESEVDVRAAANSARAAEKAFDAAVMSSADGGGAGAIEQTAAKGRARLLAADEEAKKQRAAGRATGISPNAAKDTADDDLDKANKKSMANLPKPSQRPLTMNLVTPNHYSAASIH